ncbi:TIM44-like domain-containing protein [Xanthobacter sp. KR7-225]|uniref:TIM44-like domain-containing protein n=1 Tax=Xanthobacter sp. KR7-225 TaxID=3156613 RepID=UPI0032B37D7F
MFRRTTFFAVLAIAAGLTLVAADHAEAKRGFSFGNRGSRTYQAPPATPTAPTAAPIQRSTTPQTAPAPATRAPQSAAPAARPSMFGTGLGGALMRGLLIGGLVGLLLGGGFGGLAGILGLLLQAGLIVLAVMLVMRLLRGARPAPADGAYARSGGGFPMGGGVPAGGGPSAGPSSGGLTGGLGGALGGALGGGAGAASRTAPRAPSDDVGIKGEDLEAFERLLATIQVAFGDEDQGTLMEHTTPEVFSFLADELRENAERGVRNVVSDVKLLQGDLAEAWREGNKEYATVAMRYESRDAMVDRATGKAISGDRGAKGEATEIWTFVRENGGAWKLTAIQGT